MKRIRYVLSTALIALAVCATAGSGTALAVGTTSEAAEKLFVREHDITSELRALSKVMSRELTQVAVGANAEDAIANLVAQRLRFTQLLMELLEHDEAQQASNPEIELHLAGAEGAWPELDRIIGDAISWGHLTHHEMQMCEAAARQLDIALADLQRAYRRAAIDFGVHSVILNAIAVAEEQRILSQEIPKAFILLRSGINNDENRERLVAAIGDFERDIHGLVEGDPERGLVAAPTTQIATDLQAALATWTELRNSISLDSAGVARDAEAVGRVSELSEVLYEQLNAAIVGYNTL